MFNNLLIMGSADRPHAKPLTMAEHDKKSIKSILKKPFQALFQKDKKKEKKESVINESKQDKRSPKTSEKFLKFDTDKKQATRSKETSVSELIDKFPKLEIEKKESRAIPKVTPVAELIEKFPKLDLVEKEEDEFANFTYKTVEEERVRSTSEDSGFSEKGVEDKLTEPAIETKEDSKESKKKKEKKIQTVFVSRGPDRRRVGDFGTPVHPYHSRQDADGYRQINQINRQTFSGGQVLTKCVPNDLASADYLSEINFVLNQVEQNVQNSALSSEQDREANWQMAMDFLAKSNEAVEPISILEDFPQAQIPQDLGMINSFKASVQEPNPIEEFTTANHAPFDELPDFELTDYVENHVSIFPTPPRSENTSSPLSEPFNPPASEYTLSPSLSSPLYNSDNEKFGEIYPICVKNTESEEPEAKPRERTSSMTMKQYKDLQKEISNGHTKMQCCQMNRRTCKQIFLEHMQKLEMEDRRELCVKVANLDLQMAYGVLHHILTSLSKSDKDEHIQLALFNLICERVIAQKPELFLGDFGLGLLKSSVLRCYRRPLITRYLVQCVRFATKCEKAPKFGPNDHLFHEVDAVGDNLLIACARVGDDCAEVLAELVKKEGDEVPLFDVHHANREGYNALHVACLLHSAECRREHILHVLLQHGGADIWRGDVKGDDTALHLAINSPTCELRLVMVMFRHVDRKMWKRLAHKHNRSSVTPLEYARSAVRSKARENYPHEVLEFLKKCR